MGLKKDCQSLARRLERFYYYHFSDAARLLKQQIKGQRVLVVGSGPSANDLKEVPGDVKVFTCNGGPKLFLDKHMDLEISVYLVVKGFLENRDHIKELIKKCRINTFLINDPDYIGKNKEFDGVYKRLSLEACKDAHLLKSAIRPLGLKDIQGKSSCAWCSAGMRLLQYALFFEAKEIYLIGLDLGEKGYFWDTNVSNWTHQDIDYNFIKLVGERHSHVYSLSKNSPVTQFLKFKDFT